MNRSGRVSLLAIAALLGLVLVVLILVFSKKSMGSYGADFMDALVRSDVDRLTKLTYLGNESPQEIQKEWEFATKVSAKYYSFGWKITSETQASPTSGSVSMQVTRNYGAPGSYEENFQLPMVKVGDEWKVDVGAISHEMYPGLPRRK